MEAFLVSALTVALAEIGDKTQLLSLLLVIRFQRRLSIIAGILLATVLNHAASAWLGQSAAGLLSPEIIKWVVAISFFAIALWSLVPDKAQEVGGPVNGYGAFIASTILFFLAEIGDKTQVATVILAAQYQQVVLVTAGTTLGMLAANVPVVIFGQQLMQRLPISGARIAASTVFFIMGVLTLVFA
ncbi:MAG: TMEM165/GDT1 family protein [Pseudohongiellaceae bacterium]